MAVTTAVRRIQHPGPAATQRCTVIPATAQACRFSLAPGQSLLAALVDALAPSGARSAVLTLAGGSLFPFAHVLPALAKTPEHAVYFSDRFDAAGPVRLDVASVTYGQRDGKPWLHGHAVWTDGDGGQHCGHLLPEDCMLAAPVAVSAWLLAGAGFEVCADAETRFSLFKPVAWPAQTPSQTPAKTPEKTPSPAARPVLLVRLAPNEDVCTALETVCRERDIRHATLRGGVGSTVGVRFDDGRRVEPFVTETLVHQGRVRPGPGGELLAEIDVSMVDHLGGQASGRLARGENPVLVTFELVLEPA